MIEPTRLTRDELAAELEGIALGFAAGHTLEGHVEFLISMPESPGGFDPGGEITWDVSGAYRIGNSHGQGGMTIIGNIVIDDGPDHVAKDVEALAEARQLIREALSVQTGAEHAGDQSAWRTWQARAHAWAASRP